MLPVPRKDKGEEKSNTVQSYNETSAMYKSPDHNRNVVDQTIPRISLRKTWNLKTVAIIVKQTLKK